MSALVVFLIQYHGISAADPEFPRRGLGRHHLSLGQKLGSAIQVLPHYTKLAILASNSNASDNIERVKRNSLLPKILMLIFKRINFSPKSLMCIFLLGFWAQVNSFSLFQILSDAFELDANIANFL